VAQITPIFPVAAVLVHPVSDAKMEQTLRGLFPNQLKD